MPEVRQLSPQGIQAIISRIRQGLTNAQDFIEGLASQDMVLDANAAQAMLDAGVISPQQFELLSGRNTQLLPGSQDLASRTGNFLEGVAQDAGFVGEAGVSRGEQGFRLATTALAALPGVGTIGRGAQGARAINALQRTGPLGNAGAFGVNELLRIGQLTNRGVSVEQALALLGGGGLNVSANLLESDREFGAAVSQFDTQPGEGEAEDEGSLEDDINDILGAGGNAGGEAGDPVTTPGTTGGSAESPFNFIDVPGVGRFLQFRQDVLDPETGEVIGSTLSNPVLVDEAQQEAAPLDAQTVLAITQAAADPAQRLTLQAGLSALLNRGSQNADPTTLAIANMLGVRPGQTSVSAEGLPSDILSLLGNPEEIPVAGTFNRQTVNTAGQGEDIGNRAPTEVIQERVAGLNLQNIPNLQSLSANELQALQSIAAVSGMDFSRIEELSEQLAPPGGQRVRANVRR